MRFRGRINKTHEIKYKDENVKFKENEERIKSKQEKIESNKLRCPIEGLRQDNNTKKISVHNE